jgi:hypothetical protein
MGASRELQEVEIEFFHDWYDGPLSGVAVFAGQAYWFEAESDWDPDAKVRPLPVPAHSRRACNRERSQSDIRSRGEGQAG